LGWSLLRTRTIAGKIADAASRREGLLLAAAGIGALFWHIVLNPDIVSLFASDRSLDRNVLLAVRQLRDYLPWIWGAAFLGLFLSFREPDFKAEKTVFFSAFSCHWILLMILAEPGRPDRFWLLWPLQVMIMVICLEWISRRLPRAGLAFVALAAALGFAVLPIRLYADRMESAWTEGYGGRDSDQWNVVLFLSGQAGAVGDRSLKVDYWLGDSQIPADTELPAYRFGDWFTYLLESWSGVDVLDPESPSTPTGGSWAVADSRLEQPDWLEDGEPAAVFGYYRIFRLP
jgi:hypothetical protein